MASRKQSAGVEWIGGIAAMPGYVTNEGEPYRPEMLLWMTADGAIVGNALGKPGEMIAVATENLRQSASRPMVGPPQTPTRVRVASPELAAALRAGHPGLDVVCAPTPEIDAVMASMREQLTHKRDEEVSLLGDGNSAEAVAALFRAAAVCFRAKPWKVVPADRSLLSVSIEALGVHGAVVSVIGQSKQSYGFVVFESLEDFDRYGAAADAVQRGEPPELPTHFALNFERGADVSPRLRKEIAENGWEVAAADAYPQLTAIDPDLLVRPPSQKELTLTEAICLALPEILREKKKLLDAWKTGNLYERTLTVRTHHASELQVTVRAPHEDELEQDVGDADDTEETRSAREADDRDLMRRFTESPERQALAEVGFARMLMEFSTKFGASVTELDAADLRALLFDLIPRKVILEASEASEIVAELRAFYLFLKREGRTPAADACLRVLGGGAAKKLEAALSDPSHFGMAKSLIAAGRDAGFDMSSPAGIDAWMREVQGRPIPASMMRPLPDARQPASTAPSRAKKDARKTERKARKKNRRRQ